MCHSDLLVPAGGIASPLPVVLGHEGAGIVTEVGSGVSNVVPGDHVVISLIPQCGECFFCRRGQWTFCTSLVGVGPGTLLDGTTRFRLDGRPLYQFCLASTFAEDTVIPAACAIPINRRVPLDVAALIGCGVVTGVGAARRIADIRPDDTVVVLGCGGVGLNAVQGAVLAGAAQIVAIDRETWKVDLAQTFGATHGTIAGGAEAVATVQALTGGRGADVIIEAVGTTQAFNQALELSRRGGEIVALGLPGSGSTVPVPLHDAVVMAGRTIKGCAYGHPHAAVDFPELAQRYLDGELLLDELVTRRISLAEIPQAFEAITAGEVARSLVVYD